MLISLSPHRLVVARVPEVGTLEEVVEGLDAARLKEWPPHLVEAGQGELGPGVGDRVAGEVESDADPLGVAVSGQ